MAVPEPHGPLVWIDLDASDLDVNHADILAIATIVTDQALEVLGEGPELHIDGSISVADAEAEILAFLGTHTSAERSPLCGRSVWEKRRLLARHMQTLHPFLHYRAIDVGSIRELSHHWYPDLSKPTTEGSSLTERLHTAIAALRFYRAQVFR